MNNTGSKRASASLLVYMHEDGFFICDRNHGRSRSPELVEGALGRKLRVFECLRFAVRDQFLMARRSEQFAADDGGAGAIGRKIEHHQLVITNERELGSVGAACSC